MISQTHNEQLRRMSKTQLMLLAELMPELFQLRSMGCSFAQITSLLNQSGINVCEATVHACYSKLLEARMELCEMRLYKKMELLAKAQELTDQNGFQLPESA